VRHCKCQCLLLKTDESVAHVNGFYFGIEMWVVRFDSVELQIKIV